jgi:glycosyltransferase involved in cell wall biosynthesis
VAIALLTTYLPGYRMPLYRLLAQRHGVEVLCYGGGERYAPSWFRDLDRQLESAPFPARRLRGWHDALGLGGRYEAVIAPFAGGAILPAAYAGARARRRPFVLWASVWAQPRSLTHWLSLPVTRHIYRNASAVVAYGEHVRRFVAAIRGRDEDVFVAPQAVEADLFGRPVAAAQVQAFRARHDLGTAPMVLYVGRLVEAKGTRVLARAWPLVSAPGILVVAGAGPEGEQLRRLPRVRLLGPLPRPELPVAYAAAQFALLPSIPTPRFQEPWGMVCNEAMHQGRAVIASDAVGAAAGGLVRHQQTGLVVRAGDAGALAAAIDRLLSDQALCRRLGAAAREAVAPYTYDAMLAAFEAALTAARRPAVSRKGASRRVGLARREHHDL